MKRVAASLVVCFCFVALLVPQAREVRAHGFNVYDQGAKAFGMGEAFVAQADDPTAVFYNPAGITQLEGTQAYQGFSLYFPHATFRSAGNSVMGTSAGEKTDNVHNRYFVPQLYLTHSLGEKVSLGLGVFSPFGLGQQWPDDWEGRYSPSLKASLSALTVNPVVAVKLTPRISFGLGPLAQRLEAHYKNAVLLGAPALPLTPGSNPSIQGIAKLKGSSYGYGWNSGALLTLSDHLKLGVSYTSRITQDIDGTQKLSLADGTPLSRQDVESRIVLPAIGKAGIALTLKPWVIELDAHWVEWSTYRHQRLAFENGTSVDTPKNWHDEWTWNLGTQYTVNEHVDLRGGIAYGQTPVPRSTLDPLVVGGNRTAYFLGVGTHFGKITVDLGYIYTTDASRTWDNANGDVRVGGNTISRVRGRFIDAGSHSFGAGLTYKF